MHNSTTSLCLMQKELLGNDVEKGGNYKEIYQFLAED